MKTLSLKLPDALDAKLTLLARQRQRSKSAVVREAIETLFRGNGTAQAGSFLDLAKDFAGCLEGPGDLSVNKEYFRDFGR